MLVEEAEFKNTVLRSMLGPLGHAIWCLTLIKAKKKI